jgi:hypothetical protein
MWESSRVVRETVGRSISYGEGDNPSVSASFAAKALKSFDLSSTISSRPDIKTHITSAVGALLLGCNDIGNSE